MLCDACIALEHEPTTQHLESEAMLMTERGSSRGISATASAAMC